MAAQESNWQCGPCLLEGGLRPGNPSNPRFFQPVANFHHHCTAGNFLKRNIPMHVAGNEHFLEPCPKYLLSPDSVIQQLDGMLASRSNVPRLRVAQSN